MVVVKVRTIVVGAIFEVPTTVSAIFIFIFICRCINYCASEVSRVTIIVAKKLLLLLQPLLFSLKPWRITFRNCAVAYDLNKGTIVVVFGVAYRVLEAVLKSDGAIA